ncbi:hypothetical protein C4573_00560 [Candidatus Woesearchaeota archaeon]|nr:MAG: hypothetical protein C4573_00560 [Candidatus Woesearchaeota archaeon]
MKIPGIAYLIIGAVIAGYAFFVRAKTESTAMLIFFYIGLLFIAIGGIKLLMQKKAPKHHATHPSHSYNTQQHMHQAPPAHTQHIQHQQQNTAHHIQPHHAQHTHIQQAQQQQNMHVYPQHSQQQHMFPQVVVCPVCQGRNPISANFCSRCGKNLK